MGARHDFSVFSEACVCDLALPGAGASDGGMT